MTLQFSHNLTKSKSVVAWRLQFVVAVAHLLHSSLVVVPAVVGRRSSPSLIVAGLPSLVLVPSLVAYRRRPSPCPHHLSSSLVVVPNRRLRSPSLIAELIVLHFSSSLLRWRSCCDWIVNLWELF
ncbi:hypothetical protein Ddye_014095 [Dipteronia dyeriana]|uniref:Uncharacterized protein n=1 Tax=Dipteronia dyeriana TaxID=168575 RepID=A0AAD9X7K3_9ROSI|nr:hypothetical protein Ddye_014095 [Dipteronia dyeriana]